MDGIIFSTVEIDLLHLSCLRIRKIKLIAIQTKNTIHKERVKNRE